MYAAWVVIGLITTVAAGRLSHLLVNLKHDAVNPVKTFTQQPPPPSEKCCAPSTYTYTIYDVSIRVEDGKILTDTLAGNGAYDAEGQQLGLKVLDLFSNGTHYKLQIILDYKKEESYFIFTEDETTSCISFATEGPFPKTCLPDGSVFKTYVTIGDRALKLAVWNYNDNGTSESKANDHIAITVEESECVLNSIKYRRFHPETGVEESTAYTQYSGFNLGISDPKKWFKPPRECKKKNRPTKMTEKVYMQYLGLLKLQNKMKF